jgi:DNA mismatch endonuclease (patch repair protein)
MTDHLSKTDRSALMGKVRGKDTKPEIVVRKIIHSLGFRFRLHRKDLPGCPDLVFASKRKVIFVHGCFWHRHKRCKRATTPQTHTDFWQSKFDANVSRDRRNLNALTKAGWESLIVWECSLKHVERLAGDLRQFLDSPAKTGKSP